MQALFAILLIVHCYLILVVAEVNELNIEKNRIYRISFLIGWAYFSIYIKLFKMALKVAKKGIAHIQAKMQYAKDKREFEKLVLTNYKNKKAGVKQAAVFKDEVYREYLGKKFTG